MPARVWIITAIAFISLGTPATASCPHEESGLKRWSDAATWGAVGKPKTGDNVNITEAVLLDETPPDLNNINIASTGRLVFDSLPPPTKLHVRAANIIVNGALEIGTETCLYTGDLTITLTGTRSSHGSESNPKAILVNEGGTLEIHGGKKLPWTKLNGTLNPLTDASDDVIFEHKTHANNDIDWRTRGVVAYVFSINDDGKPQKKQFNVFDLPSKGDKLADLIDGVEDGDVLMMASQRTIRQYAPNNIWSKQNRTYDAVERLLYGSVTQNSMLRDVKDDGTSWAFVYEKGVPNSLKEVTNPIGVGSVVHYIKSDDLVFTSEVSGHSNFYLQQDNFKVTTLNGIFPLVNVIDDVTTWLPGDVIVFASTDYNYLQAEERTLVECDSCTSTQFRINAPVEYMHFGEALYGDSLDMRGEVGLLSRNVKIHGEMQATCPAENGNCDGLHIKGIDTFGAHIKVLKGYANVHIEGAELFDVGQQTDLGRYPIHFHMCFEKVDTARVPYIKENSIHHTHARCVTIHGSHGVQIIDNVCYSHRGHGFFLEDGGEKWNVFDGNLAMSAHRTPGKLDPLDAARPAGFWMTNPNTIFKNNVAAGGLGNGIWFIYPDQPYSPSREYNLTDLFESERTNILEIDNNVAHSNHHTGIMIGGRLKEDRTIACCNLWQPREDPKNITSQPIEVKLERFTGYKNKVFNLWFEGGLVNVEHVSVADSWNGVLVTNDRVWNIGDFGGSLSKSVVVGDSSNIGKPEAGDVRSLPYQKTWRNKPHSGVSTWHGPSRFSDIWFDGFMQNDIYDNAAIAQKRASSYFHHVTTVFSGMQFAFDDGPGLGNRAISGTKGVDLGWEDNLDGQLQDGFTYVNNDGSRTYVVKPDHFSAAADDCVIRTNWRMALCTTKYGHLKLGGAGDFLKQAPDAVFVRDELPSAQLGLDMEFRNGPAVVLDGSRTYTLHFVKQISTRMVLSAEGMETNDVLRVGICLPTNATFKIQSYFPTKLWSNVYFTEVSSLAELDATDENDGKKIFHDKTTGMLYYKFINTRDREDERVDCADGECPDLRIYILSGNLTDCDCRDKLYGDSVNMAKPPIPVVDDVIPANGASTPPEGWGAGLTRPFKSRLRKKRELALNADIEL